MTPESQEYLDEIYEAIANSDNPALLGSLERFIATTIDNVQQKQSENEKLDTALKRATEKNSEIARNLEDEMDEQMQLLESKIREEERRKAERMVMEAQDELQKKEKELQALNDKLKETLESEKDKEDGDGELKKEIENKLEENQALHSQLREYQTQLALMRSEVATLKSEYDEQGERLAKERQTVLSCVQEQENVTRQLHLLHEANKKLHDTNDDLRSALQAKRNDLNERTPSPSKRPSIMVASPLSFYGRPPSQRGSIDDQSSKGSRRSSLASPTFRTDDEFSTLSSQLPRPNDDDDINESSLMSELLAADERGDNNEEGILNSSMRLPDGVLPRHSIETDYIDSDAEKDPEFVENNEPNQLFENMSHQMENEPSYNAMAPSDRELFMQQLKMLCDTNERLSKSNDELRNALELLNDQVKKKDKKRRSLRQPSHSDYNSSRTNTPSSSRHDSEAEQPNTTSSPKRKVKTSGEPSTSSDSETATMSGLVPQSNPELESTPNQDTEDEPTLEPQLCECGEEIKDDNQLCKNCKSLADLGEDPVEPQSVTTDESSSWLLDQLFEELPSNKCACGNNLDNGKCDKCEQLNDSERLVTEPKQTNYVDIGTQVDVSAEFPDENLDELSQTMHICQDDNCECGEEEVLSELDKSVQVSEVALLLNDTKEKLESEDSLENENDPVNEKDPEKDSDCEEKSRSSPDHVAVKPVVHDEVAAELIYDEVQKQADEDYFEKLNKICRTCNQERDYTKSEAGECLCSKDQSELDLDNEDTSNKSDPDKTADKSVLHESTLPDYSDMTSNYTERDTDIRTQNTEHPSDVDSLAMAARHRAGMPIADGAYESASETTGINSSYSVLQNIDDELSMYARREPDEEFDEDDMTIDELQRIKEMTSSGSDTDDDLLDSYEERKPAIGADASTETDSGSNIELGEPERMYKLVLAGNAAVGKSSFILRLCKNRFYPSLNSTLGVDFQVKSLLVDNHVVALQLWDTAGQERFRSIAKSYFRRVDGVLLLYDVTSEHSFLDVREWLQSIEESTSKPVPLMLCGNKIDMRSKCKAQGINVVSRQQGEKLAKEIGALFIETSAKDGSNVAEACIELARKLRTIEDQELQEGMKLGENGYGNQKKKGNCCK